MPTVQRLLNPVLTRLWLFAHLCESVSIRGWTRLLHLLRLFAAYSASSRQEAYSAQA
jgi:hypothetical protein